MYIPLLIIGIIWFVGFLYFANELVMKNYAGEISKNMARDFAILFGVLSIAATWVGFS